MTKAILIFVVIAISASPEVAWGQKQKLQIHVVDDLEQGIKSNLSMILPDGKVRTLGPTDEEGRMRISAKCGQGSTLQAEPKSPLYYSNRKDCPLPDEKLVVSKKIYMRNLRANAKVLEVEGETAKAALVYNEIAIRSADFDPKLARKSEEKTYSLFVSDITKGSDASAYLVTDPSQRKKVLTDEGKKVVKDFQQSNNIEASGVIDYTTLSTAAKAHVATYLFKKIDSTKAAASKKAQ